MSLYTLTHHQLLSEVLENFNSEFLFKNNIIFGGGTRIALEIEEYRESVDIDFLCPTKESYRAVREQVTNKSLGLLLKEEFTYLKEIRPDRYAVRTFIEHKGTPVKLEIVSFDNYELEWIRDLDKFPVPFLDKRSCFYTKLLANSDRYLQKPHKDIFDLLAMRKQWGEIPTDIIEMAGSHNGTLKVLEALTEALNDIISKPLNYVSFAKDLSVNKKWIECLVYEYPAILLKEVSLLKEQYTK